jgi:hypothetical protein
MRAKLINCLRRGREFLFNFGISLGLIVFLIASGVYLLSGDAYLAQVVFVLLWGGALGVCWIACHSPIGVRKTGRVGD